MAVQAGLRVSSRCRYTRGSGECCIEQPADRRCIDGLDEVVIESSGQRALAIHRLAVAGQCNQVNLVTAWNRADLTRELVAIDDRQADIEDRRQRLERL